MFQLLQNHCSDHSPPAKGPSQLALASSGEPLDLPETQTANGLKKGEVEGFKTPISH